MFRQLRPYQLIIDIVLSVLLFAVSLPWNTSSGIMTDGGAARMPAVALAILASLVLCGAFALRRLSPPLALAIAWVAALVQMASLLPPLPTDLAVLGVLYSCAAYGSRRMLWLSLGSAFTGAVIASVYIGVLVSTERGSNRIEDYLRVLLLVLVATGLALMLAWTSGALVRTARRAARNREDARRALADAAAEAERTRIARDMHDVVAHSLAVVIAQADGARYAAAADGDAADRALRTIASTARAALTDVRVLLAQLRHREADGPQPSLADLDELLIRMRQAGLVLDVEVAPGARDTGAAVQLALYRILQEALTNALRHGADPRVRLRILDRGDELTLEVRNAVGPGAGAPAAAAGGGHGVVGMGERASLVGGALHAGREGEHEWVVRATLPAPVDRCHADTMPHNRPRLEER